MTYAPMSDAETLGLLSDMLRTPSLSGQEQPLACLLVERMSALGLATAIDCAGNAIGATSGDPLRSDPATVDIILLGHMDTVGGDVPYREAGGRIHARGAVDAKGPLAAMIAATVCAPLPHGARLIVIGAVEEETPASRGARALISRYAPAACIIGEPSGADGFTIGYKGRLLARYSIASDGAHTAGPAPAPADTCFAWWSAVLRDCHMLAPPDASAFHSIQAGLRSVNTRSDGLTDSVDALAGFRLPPGVDPTAVESICLGHAGGATVECLGHERAILADRASPVARALSQAIRAFGARARPLLKTGTSDMNVVGPAWNCPIAAYGPGDSSLDHTPDEHIEIQEFLRAIGVLRSAVGSLALELAAARPDPAPAPLARS
ncbi:MAG: [LysW]-lysine hydrolase [Phycisphaeraceae bacterium]|nr:[LysW]-lysine hydrolase [Phycisphaeraceae bacterium]